MKFAVSMFPTANALRPHVLAAALEDRGFDSLFFPDHSHIPLVRRNQTAGGDGVLDMYYADGMDPFVALATAALATKRIKIGTAICLLVQRDPIQTAKEVASLDVISDGRVILGIGAGWDVEEMENHGTPYARRFKVLRERIEAMRVLWSQEEPEYHGEFVNFDPCRQEPKPLQKYPPIYLGNNHPRALDRVLRYADGWMPHYKRVQNLAGLFAELQEKASQNGRGPIPVMVDHVPPEPAAIEELEKLGVERCCFFIPPASEETILPLLDSYARLIERFPAND
jgi:probable F420-dependent oxidoreductase